LLLADPDLAAGGAGPPTSPWWHLLLLAGDPATARSGAPAGAAVALAHLWGGLPGPVPPGPRGVAAALAALLTLPLLALGLAALLRRPVAATAAGWGVALAGLATALLAERVPVGATGWGLDAGQAVTGPVGPGLSLVALGALAAAVGLLRRGRHTLRPPRPPRRSRRGRVAGLVRGVVTVLGAVIAFTGPVAVLAGWSGQGLRGPGHGVAEAALPALEPVRPDVLPALAADEAEGQAQARTLVVRTDRTQVRWALAGAAGPRFGDDSAALAVRRLDVPPPATETALVTPILAALLGDGGQDVTGALAGLGVGSVLLVPPAGQDAVLALDSSPGLVRVSQAGGSVLWRVELPATAGAVTRPARARVLDGSGRVVQALPSRGAVVDVRIAPGGADRIVRLAERADGDWRAVLDGHRLSAVPGSWDVAFALPAAGGRLRVWRQETFPAAARTAQSAVLAVAVLGLLPLPRLRRRVAVPTPPARSQPVPRAVGAPSPADLPPMPRIFDEDHPADGEVPPLFSDDPVTPSRDDAATTDEPAEPPVGDAVAERAGAATAPGEGR
ncbi:MAG TPA: hypothetical protein VI248_29625, partial [Kineosporiaceae bacterium]